MEVVDAFCGAGGFSAGAMVAGCRVTMGIDSDPVPVRVAWMRRERRRTTGQRAAAG